MSIPTSNKPGNEEKVPRRTNAEREKEIKEAIIAVKELVDVVTEQVRAVEKRKVQSMRDIGGVISRLSEDMTGPERKELIHRFCRESGGSEATYYRSYQYARLFTDKDFDYACERGLTVRVANAVVSFKDEKIRSTMLRRAVDEGLSAEQIREIKGTTVDAGKAAGEGKKQKQSEKPPVKVFTQSNDRAEMMREAVTASTDAVARLASCKSEDESKTALKVLFQFRDQLEKLSADITSFMKFTAGLAQDKKGKGGK